MLATYECFPWVHVSPLSPLCTDRVPRKTLKLLLYDVGVYVYLWVLLGNVVWLIMSVLGGPELKGGLDQCPKADLALRIGQGCVSGYLGLVVLLLCCGACWLCVTCGGRSQPPPPAAPVAQAAPPPVSCTAAPCQPPNPPPGAPGGWPSPAPQPNPGLNHHPAPAQGPHSAAPPPPCNPQYQSPGAPSGGSPGQQAPGGGLNPSGWVGAVGERVGEKARDIAGGIASKLLKK